MMPKKIMIALSFLFLTTSLSGCDQKNTSTYYLQHPLTTSKAYQRCREQAQQTSDQAAACQVVYAAYQQIAALIREQQEDPEAFGQKILDLETKLVQEQATPLSQQTPEALASSQALAEQIKMRLAVVSLNSPG